MSPILDKFGEFHSLETAIHIYEIFNVKNFFNIMYLSMSPLIEIFGSEDNCGWGSQEIKLSH